MHFTPGCSEANPHKVTNCDCRRAVNPVKAFEHVVSLFKLKPYSMSKSQAQPKGASASKDQCGLLGSLGKGKAQTFSFQGTARAFLPPFCVLDAALFLCFNRTGDTASTLDALCSSMLGQRIGCSWLFLYGRAKRFCVRSNCANRRQRKGAAPDPVHIGLSMPWKYCAAQGIPEPPQ